MTSVLQTRTSGVLLHPTSLPSPGPIGDFGAEAFAFADFLHEAGQSWWQMLPIGPAGRANSPYHALSTFAGSPLLVSLAPLRDRGWLPTEKNDVEPLPSSPSSHVNFALAARDKLHHLRRAWSKFAEAGSIQDRSDFADFVRDESHWLDDFALFCALQKQFHTPDWSRWDAEYRNRQPQALDRARDVLAAEIHFHQFAQWQFSEQWFALREYCRQRHIGLIGDVPIFPAHQSADVWANQQIFKLDAAGKPTVVAGVPPDYFSETGQKWNLPLYRWDVLKSQNYDWWVKRLQMATRRFDILRLDHFIGFVRAYEVPAHDRTAKNGKYEAGPAEDFFHALRGRLGSLPLIAEDLGHVTPEVHALRDQFNLPGMRVLQFEFEPSKEADAFKPDRYCANCVLYPGTHDNDTTLGWFQQLNEPLRSTIPQALSINESGFCWAFISAAFATNANTVIVPAQDLLKLGTESRMNIPGVERDNWRWRIPHAALTGQLAAQLRELTAKSNRLRIR